MLGTHLGRRVVPLATSTARRTRRPSDSSSSRRTSGSGTGRPNVRRASNNASLRRALAGRGLLTYTIGLAVPGNRLGSSETAACLGLQTDSDQTTAPAEHVGKILADGVEDVMIVPKLAGVADAVPVTLRPGRAVLQVERTALASKAVTTDRSQVSRLQNSLGCGLNSRFPGEHSVVLDCRLRVLGREDSSGEPRCVERRPSTCLHRHRWMTGPGRAPALDRRLADDTLFVTSPGARAGRRSAPARRTCSGTSPSRRRGRGHGDRRTRP